MWSNFLFYYQICSKFILDGLSSLCGISSFRNYTTHKCIKQLYYTYEYSSITYGIHVYGITKDCNINKIQLLQIRIILPLYVFSISHLLCYNKDIAKKLKHTWPKFLIERAMYHYNSESCLLQGRRRLANWCILALEDYIEVRPNSI